VTSLQQRLLNTGGRLIRPARYFTLQLAKSYLTRPLFRADRRAHRATRVASDVIERMAPVGSKLGDVGGSISTVGGSVSRPAGLAQSTALVPQARPL